MRKSFKKVLAAVLVASMAFSTPIATKAATGVEGAVILASEDTTKEVEDVISAVDNGGFFATASDLYELQGNVDATFSLTGNGPVEEAWFSTLIKVFNGDTLYTHLRADNWAFDTQVEDRTPVEYDGDAVIAVNWGDVREILKNCTGTVQIVKNGNTLKVVETYVPTDSENKKKFVETYNISIEGWSGVKVQFGSEKYAAKITGIETKHIHDAAPATFDTTAEGYVAPTCTEKGTGVYTCVCNAKLTAEIPALGHDEMTTASPEYTVTKEAGCLENGAATYKCTKCNETINGVITATGNHTMPTGTVPSLAPTCTTDGKISYTCEVCNTEVKDEAVPALGHSMKVVAEKAPTADAAGNYEYYACERCADCGEAYADATMTQKVTSEDVTVAKGGQLEKSTDYATISGKNVWWHAERPVTPDFKITNGTTKVFTMKAVENTANLIICPELTAAMGTDKTGYFTTNPFGDGNAWSAEEAEEADVKGTPSAFTKVEEAEEGHVYAFAVKTTVNKEDKKTHNEVELYKTTIELVLADETAGKLIGTAKFADYYLPEEINFHVVSQFGDWAIAEGSPSKVHVHDFKDAEITTEKEATCKENGIDKAACNECGETVDIETVGTHKTKEVPATEATCSKEGNKKYFICETCGGIFKDKAAGSATTLEDRTIAKLDHEFEAFEVPATTAKEGQKGLKCKVCGETKDVKTIAKLTASSNNGSTGSTATNASLKKAKITVKNGKKAASKVTVKKGKSVKLTVSVDSKAKLSVAKLSKKDAKKVKVTLKKGKLTIKGKKKGKVTVTVKAAKTVKYKAASKKIKVTVK